MSFALRIVVGFAKKTAQRPCIVCKGISIMLTESFRIVGVVATTLFLAAGCSDDTSGQADTSTTSGTGSTSNPITTTQGMTTMVAEESGTTVTQESGTTVAPGTSTGSDSDSSTSDSGTTGESSSSSSDSGTTGAADCVDEDIRMAVGAAVASGSTRGRGDDFDWENCFGGAESGGFIDRPDVGATDGNTEPGPFSSKRGGATLGGKKPTGDDYVIAWTPPSTAPYVLSLEGSSYDTVLSVHAPECGSTGDACNDDCYDVQSGLVYDATMGETVFIVIDGYGGDVGDFSLSITEGSDPVCDVFETSDSGFDDDVGPSTSGTGGVAFR